MSDYYIAGVSKTHKTPAGFIHILRESQVHMNILHHKNEHTKVRMYTAAVKCFFRIVG